MSCGIGKRGSPQMSTAYAELETRFKRLNLVRQSAGVLQWDMEALMPSGGAETRTEQLAALRVIVHQMLTDKALGELFASAESQADLDRWQTANLRDMKREWRHATCLPDRLVEARSRAESESE